MTASCPSFQQLLEDYHKVSDVIILGGGPSLQQFDFSHVHPTNNLLIICCNQAIFLCPHAQIAHHSDFKWWNDYHEQLAHLKNTVITGCGLGTNQKYSDPRVNVLHTYQPQKHETLFVSPTCVYGNNSGLQALSMAHLFMPQRIWLSGFDLEMTGNRTHGYLKEEKQDLSHLQKMWGYFLKDFTHFEKLRQTLWSQVYPDDPLAQIYNLNPNSGLKIYPFQQPSFITTQ